MQLFTRMIGPALIPKGPYVLIVDDEDLSVKPLADLIRYSGYATVATRSATDALAACHHRRPSLIVTDLDMPGPDGRALAHRVRRRHPLVPMVLITGQNLDQPAWRIPDGLFSAVFSKPLDLHRFLIILERLMITKPGPSPSRA